MKYILERTVCFLYIGMERLVDFIEQSVKKHRKRL